MKDYLETECVEKIKKECLLQVFDEIDSTNEYLKKLVRRKQLVWLSQFLSWLKDRQPERNKGTEMG